MEMKKTPLNAVHRSLGAKMVDFGGWDMPVQYSGIKEEHLAVRNKAGLFDVSHMGEIRVKGKDALAFIQRLITSDVSDAKIGQARYGVLCYPHGGIVDDLLVYHVGTDEYLLIVNAGNIDKDWSWINEQKKDEDVVLTNESDAYGQIAIQGPLALSILQTLTKTKLEDIAYYSFEMGQVSGKDCILSRTGYTGEDGFEVYCAAGDTEFLWNEMMKAGNDDLLPCGLGARDTLRFEAKMPLYGHEMTEDINPLETGLGRFIALDKGDFIGREPIAKMKEEGRPRKIVGFEMIDRGVPRAGYVIEKDGEEVGSVTTGTYSPTFEKSMGLAIVATDKVAVDDEIDVIIRGKKTKAKVVKTPFYKRSK